MSALGLTTFAFRKTKGCAGGACRLPTGLPISAGPRRESRLPPAAGGALQGHSRFLSCLAVHPRSDMVVTGAEDATVHVWALPGVDEQARGVEPAWRNQWNRRVRWDRAFACPQLRRRLWDSQPLQALAARRNGVWCGESQKPNHCKEPLQGAIARSHCKEPL